MIKTYIQICFAFMSVVILWWTDKCNFRVTRLKIIIITSPPFNKRSFLWILYDYMNIGYTVATLSNSNNTLCPSMKFCFFFWLSVYNTFFGYPIFLISNKIATYGFCQPSEVFWAKTFPFIVLSEFSKYSAK